MKLEEQNILRIMRSYRIRRTADDPNLALSQFDRKTDVRHMHNIYFVKDRWRNVSKSEHAPNILCKNLGLVCESAPENIGNSWIEPQSSPLRFA